MAGTPAGFLVATMVDEDACTLCGRCLRACPGASVAGETEDAPRTPDDLFPGPLRKIWWGWARDAQTRRSGASGGVVTALVRRLLETDAVQAALMTRWSPDDPLRHEAVVIRSPEELQRSQKSRYCPVALNTDLRWLLAFDRVAIVGLPCHLRGVERAAELLGADFPETVRIGLFCDRTLSTLLIDRLISVAGLPPESVAGFEYRDKGWRGWPGDVRVCGVGGESVFLDREERMRRKEPYTPVRCRVCPDAFNVPADIACGDGYGAPHSDDGMSVVLARTQRGEEAIAAAADALELERVSPERALRLHHVEQRRDSCLAYARAFAELRPGAPGVLPRAWDDGVAIDPRVMARHRATLRRDLAFEEAASEEAARSIALAAERQENVRLLPRRARRALIRAAKWCLGILPGGSRIIERLRSARG
jgi:coenzyme F420 hydrogenase subunit beta